MNTSASPDLGIQRWQRWLLPAVIGVEEAERDEHGGTTVPRSVRDWVVDFVLFGFALIVCFGELWTNHREVGTTLFVIDAVLGIPCCLLLWLRRRNPLAVGWVIVACSTLSEAAGGAAIVALFTVAVHCQPRRTFQVASLAAFAAVTCAVLYTHPHHFHFNYGTLFFWLVVTDRGGRLRRIRARPSRAAAVAARTCSARRGRAAPAGARGAACRARSDRARDARCAGPSDLIAERPRGRARVQPGCLAEEIARAAGVIRVSARAAQEELREVIGVLRAGSELEDLQPPQPTITDLTTLVAESRAAGMDVSFKDTLQDRSLSPILGRTVYRVVQEALTNARKHAAGQVVTITLEGDPADRVRVEVVNRPWVGQGDADGDRSVQVESGMGLVGLTERVTLIGGELLAEPLAGGGFRLLATLPWSDLDA